MIYPRACPKCNGAIQYEAPTLDDTGARLVCINCGWNKVENPGSLRLEKLRKENGQPSVITKAIRDKVRHRTIIREDEIVIL